MSEIEKYNRFIDWLDTQHDDTCETVRRWADINSWSRNTEGLARMLTALETELQVLKGSSERIDLPAHLREPDGSLVSSALGQALRIRKRPSAPLKALLCCHMDTVYPPDHPFQSSVRINDNTLQGPGVTDAKGGLAIMLKAAQAFERCPWAENLGWEILVGPDEEIGSPGSSHLLKEAAVYNDVGLIFEPCFPDGNLVGARKGSGNFTIVAHGKSAHAGRDPHLGRNAICALARLIVDLNAFAASEKGITVNVGYVHGGGPLNVVPEMAVCGFNARIQTVRDQVLLEESLARAMEGIEVVDGVSLARSGGFQRPPKPLTPAWQWLLESVVACGRDLDLQLEWRDSGGACDGNNLLAEGLPTVDALGARGGEIHSAGEYVLLDSLTERAKLTALLLMKLASGDIRVPERQRDDL